MYTNLHNRCNSTISDSSSTKFLIPNSCQYYGKVNLKHSSNVVLNTNINITYKFTCSKELLKNFKQTLSRSSGSSGSSVNKNGFDPNYWGPGAWKFLHIISLAYPENPSVSEQKSAREFFNSLTDLLPCNSCAKHYTEYIDTNPVDVSSRDTLANWVVDLHNDVDKRLGKPTKTYEDVLKQYRAECDDCNL